MSGSEIKRERIWDFGFDMFVILKDGKKAKEGKKYGLAFWPRRRKSEATENLRGIKNPLVAVVTAHMLDAEEGVTRCTVICHFFVTISTVATCRFLRYLRTTVTKKK